MLSDVIVEVCTSSTDAVQVKQATATTTDAFNIRCIILHVNSSYSCQVTKKAKLLYGICTQ